jgi:hypothetical protein
MMKLDKRERENDIFLRIKTILKLKCLSNNKSDSFKTATKNKPKSIEHEVPKINKRNPKMTLYDIFAHLYFFLPLLS